MHLSTGSLLLASTAAFASIPTSIGSTFPYSILVNRKKSFHLVTELRLIVPSRGLLPRSGLTADSMPNCWTPEQGCTPFPTVHWSKRNAFVLEQCASEKRTWVRISLSSFRAFSSRSTATDPSLIYPLEMHVPAATNVKSCPLKELYSRVNFQFARRTRWPLRLGVMELRGTRASVSTFHFSP